MAKLSNEKWRDDKALAQINEASADKRLAKVFEKAHQESSTDPLGYVHSAVENRMERWDRVSLGRFFRKARSEYETTDAHMARIPERSPKHAIAVPPTHTPEDYARRKSFYQDHYDTLQHKELAKRLLVEDQKPAWQLRLERQLGQASLQEDTVQATLEQSIETRFTRDSAEALEHARRKARTYLLTTSPLAYVLTWYQVSVPPRYVKMRRARAEEGAHVLTCLLPPHLLRIHLEGAHAAPPHAPRRTGAEGRGPCGVASRGGAGGWLVERLSSW